MKGKKEFTQQEIDTIELLIEQKLNAPSNKQKVIRDKIRDIGFYWTDFYGRTVIYNIQNFKELIKNGSIQLIDESKKDSNNTSVEKENEGVTKQEELQLNKNEDASAKNQCTCFPPLVDANSKILVLGTMPGERSLEKGEYYANANNCFWKIISDLFNKGQQFKDDEYEKKCDCLRKNGIALWDTLASCEREGSLDENIKEEKPNDIKNLLQEYPNIKRIIFNGKKPKEKFNQEIKCEQCIAPSTSSANTIKYEKKFECWKNLLIINEEL